MTAEKSDKDICFADIFKLRYGFFSEEKRFFRWPPEAERRAGAVAARIRKNKIFFALARKWTIFGGSVLTY
ncbi:hypothetical protein, partial [uncultured Desulfovibrio sp.]|uniref:hypothetical protein n=1 Tax=uncultured Desulfovibrio sp. TaxID=167968 RepID=UPI00262EE542